MLNREATARKLHRHAAALERNYPQRASELRKVAVALLEPIYLPPPHMPVQQEAPRPAETDADC